MKQTILGGILASTALTTAAFAQETLTAVHAFPESLIYTKSFLEFVDKVNTAGEGVVQIEVRGGPEAIGMFQQPDAVRDGIVDMVYTPGSFYGGALPEKDALVASNLTAVETRENGGIELIDREFVSAIQEGRTPNGDVADVLSAMETLDRIEKTLG